MYDSGWTGSAGVDASSPRVERQAAPCDPGGSASGDAGGQQDRFAELVEDYLAQYRQGACPSVAEYAARHPEHAQKIRELFPALLVIERLKPAPLDWGRDGERGGDSSGGLPSRLGDFRIVGERGRGGMGVVYEAVQESLGRRVALKVLSESTACSPRVLERFRREAQAAARLHHTNIVPVFGVGEQDGKHYYVMQFIPGCSVDRVLAELVAGQKAARSAEEMTEAEAGGGTSPRRDAVSRSFARTLLTGGLEPVSPQPAGVQQFGPSNPESTTRFRVDRTVVSGAVGPRDDEASAAVARADGEGPASLPALGAAYWRSVAGLGVQVASALHYAHKHGVLHRDVKPANLLVDEQGTVWITDFGLAKLAGQEDLTLAGDVVGTLRYMAPEQLKGDVDARSDVYTLGLTLYELLTLRPAFNEKSHHRLLRQVSDEAPPRPRSINPQVPRDLETIVLKALSRDPGHRYASAGQLADDLGRFLEDRPIRARRISRLEHAWRWSRRNPLLTGVSVTALVLLVAFASVASIGYLHRTKALEVESELRVRAQSETLRAEANLHLAAEAFEDVFSKIGDAPPSQGLHETTEQALYSTVSPAVVNKRDAAVLQSLLEYYDRFAEQNRDNVRWQHETARAHRRVGDIYQVLGRLQEAEGAYRKVLDFYESPRAASSEEPSRALAVAAVHNELGRLARRMGRFHQSLREHRQALTLLTASPPDASMPADVRFELARTHDSLGFLSAIRPFGLRMPGKSRWRFPDARDSCEKALDVYEELIAEAPTNGHYRSAMAECYRHLWNASFRGGSKLRPGAVEERKAFLKKAIEIFEGLVADFPDNPHYARQLATTLAFSSGPGPYGRRPPEAVGRLERAAEMMEEVVAEYPDVPEYRSTLVMCCSGLAEALADADDLDQAVDRHRQCVALNRSLVGDCPSVDWYRVGLTRSLLGLAKMERRRSEFQEARRLIEELIQLEASATGAKGRGPFSRALLADAHAELARVLTNLDEPGLADEASKKARQLRCPAPPPRKPSRLGPPKPKRRHDAARGDAWPGSQDQACG